MKNKKSIKQTIYYLICLYEASLNMNSEEIKEYNLKYGICFAAEQSCKNYWIEFVYSLPFYKYIRNAPKLVGPYLFPIYNHSKPLSVNRKLCLKPRLEILKKMYNEID